MIYWKEEDSVSLARLDNVVDQDGEPNVGDSVKVRFQRLVCQGQVAEVGTLQVIQQRVNDFLDGTYTPFSRKRPASPLPLSEISAAKRVSTDKENVTHHKRGRGRGQVGAGRASRAIQRGRGRGTRGKRGRGGRGSRSSGKMDFRRMYSVIVNA